MSIVPMKQDGEGEGSNSLVDAFLGSRMELWDPFHFMPAPFSNMLSGLGLGSSVNTRLDWRENSKAHVWKVVLPGFTDEDVLVELQDERVLQVSVESGKFMSRFKVPDDANLEQLKAKMHNGVLLITVPKYQQASNIRVVEIEGSD
ncbi:18.2 kDa class I heat shock protein-like [Arachis stenosperma]|uniref:18.2 kDa class I heat shock protein-like n=1 Tax=Arachis stenosperma TaxID=217475 RepID=UPI0025AD09A0|nr:18.2 kDa class I heat shock protein-like [Arachis stenosperma]